MEVQDGATLEFSDKVEVYCENRVDIDSTVITYNNIPRNLKLTSLAPIVKPEGIDHDGDMVEIEIEANGRIFCDSYAQQNEVDIEDNSEFFGYVIGGSLEISESAKVHYDRASGMPTDEDVRAIRMIR